MASSNVLTSSGDISSDSAIVTRPCRIGSVSLVTDGTNAATLIVYDNASAASGRVLLRLSVAGADRYVAWSHSAGIEASRGVFVDISGTGAVANVAYILE